MNKNTGSVHKSLGLASPWEILEDQYDEKEKVRRVTVTCTDASSLACPECNQVCPFYDLRTPRSWRHLDTCKYRNTIYMDSRTDYPYWAAKSRTIFHKFVQAPATVITQKDQIVVRFTRRAHNTVLRTAGYVGPQGPISWMHDRNLILEYA